jgi:capsular polysaccharide biosynthesis protein
VQILNFGGNLNPIVLRRIDQIRRRWWVVLLVAGVAILSAVLPLLNTSPKYVGKSTLVLSSTGRTPEQDAVMAVGYATLFNDPATIVRLTATHKIPEGVTLAAGTVATSPILAIEATADDPEVAQDAAQTMAYVFRDDINLVRQADYDKAIVEAQAQLDSLLRQPGPDGSVNPLVPVVQTRLDAMRDNSTNKLQVLQLRAGVTKLAPNIVLQLGLRGVAGLLLGILAALAMAALSTRLADSADLLNKTGIEPLVEVPAGGSIERNRLREDRLRTLANIVSLQDLPKSTVVALTDSRGARGARDLAEALARLSAQQGYRTVLVYADNNASHQTQGPGFNDVLADSGLANSVLKLGAVGSLKVMPSGSVVADRYSLTSRERIVAVFDELRTGADTIFIVAPSIADTIDSQPICAAADLTVVVVGRRSSRAADVTAAVDALADAHAVLLGAVMIDGKSKRTTGPAVGWRRTPRPADEPAEQQDGCQSASTHGGPG